MANQKGSSKADTFVKLILVFFISLLSFSIGTFVGKKFSDNQHQLALLEPSAQHDRDVASIPEDAGEVKPKAALNDEEISKLAEEFVTDDTKSEAPKAKEEPAKDNHVAEAVTEEHKATAPVAEHKEAAPAATTKKEAHNTEPQKAAVRVAEGQPASEPVVETKSAAQEKSRIPSSLPNQVAQSSVGKYTIQVASYTTEAEATKFAEELRAKGIVGAHTVQAVAKGSTVYRVIVGLYATVDEAKKKRTEVMAQAKLNSAFIQKIQ